MYEVRSFRRWGGIAFALLLPMAVALPLSCATGGSGETDDGGGLFEGGSPVDTGMHPDGPPGDSKAPPLDGGTDTSFVDTSVDTGHADSGPPETGPGDTTAKDVVATDTKPAKDTGTTKDTGGPDTAGCTSVTVSDAGAAPTVCPAPVTGSCGMASLAAFTPTWIPPTGYHQGLCTKAEINTIYADCFGTAASMTACAVDEATACYTCLVSAEGSASYGPLISSGGIVSVNQGGCIDLLEPCNMACAEASLGVFQCENAACETNCPVTDTASYDAYVTCADTALGCDPMGCASYYNESTNCEKLITGASHPASVCMTTLTGTAGFKALYDAAAALFCGP